MTTVRIQKCGKIWHGSLYINGFERYSFLYPTKKAAEQNLNRILEEQNNDR